jgi:hypothetical protein
MIGEQLAPVQGGLRNGTVYDYPLKASVVCADVGGHDKIEKVLTIVVTPRTVNGTGGALADGGGAGALKRW